MTDIENKEELLNEYPAPEVLAEPKAKNKLPMPLVIVGVVIALFIIAFAATGAFSGNGAALGEMTEITAQDGSYTIDIPAGWLCYNEDLGDYFSAAEQDNDYFMMIMRVAKADLPEDYLDGAYQEWLCNIYLTDENLSLRAETQDRSYTLNGMPVRELHFAHASEEGEDYDEFLTVFDQEEYYYVMNFYCDAVNVENGTQIKEQIHKSFSPVSADERPAIVYGENDSLSYISNSMYEAADADLTMSIGLYDDWTYYESDTDCNCTGTCGGVCRQRSYDAAFEKIW